MTENRITVNHLQKNFKRNAEEVSTDRKNRK